MDITAIHQIFLTCTSVTTDSRNCPQGSLFIALKGESFNGNAFAARALESGSAYAIVDEEAYAPAGDTRYIVVENSLKTLQQLANYHRRQMRTPIIGITGTNGKTTTTNVIKHILTANGYLVGLIGTIQNEIGDQILHTDNTTPMVYDLMALYRKMADAGCDYVVMEVSSFGLVQHRIGPTHFRAAVFTNLTQDHLDYHKTMEAYYQAKKMLFSITDYALINIDDDYGKRLAGEVTCAMETYGISSKADYYADAIK